MIILESFLLWIIAGVAAMLILQYFGKAPYKPGRLKNGLRTLHASGHNRVPRDVQLATSSAALAVVDPDRQGAVARAMRQNSFVDGQ